MEIEMFSNADEGVYASSTSEISGKEIKFKELDGLDAGDCLSLDRLDIELLTNPKSSSIVSSLSF